MKNIPIAPSATFYRRIATLAIVAASTLSAVAQTRVLGLDISAWQGNISQTTWNNIHNVENRQFIILRSSRGGTTGVYNQNYPNNNFGTNTLSQRYDDPYFVQNINRVATGGMYAGSYHFSRPDIIAITTNSAGIPNSGTDEADHFIQMAGPWMRPGYLMPVHDLEAGDGIRTDNEMAQFTIDFSNRIYEKMGVRPAIYINGNYAAFVLATASLSLRDQLAQPATNPPTPVSPCHPALWSARWPNQANPNAIDVQNAEPKDTYAEIYGPWDNYGVMHPWTFWQYASTLTLPSFGAGSLDADVARGGIEFLKDQLVPAVWTHDQSGDWNTLTNWNSGITPVAPVTGPGQVAPVGTQTLPTPRLPGAVGAGGVTSGTNDTLILERPNTNITVTLASGTYNIRKLYMRETLNITGGSLSVNFAPSTDSTTNGAQFSGPVTLSGAGSFSAHTLQVDAAQTFTLAGGTLTLNTINLMPGATPAQIAISGNIAINALSNVTAAVRNGTGSGSSGFIDLSAGTRTLTIGDGSSEVDLSVDVAISNGGIIKSGAGTMRLNSANTYAGGTTVSAGRLLVNNTTNSGTGSGAVTVNGGYLGGTGIISGVVAVNTAGTIAPGTASAIGKLTLGSVPTFSGTNFNRINRNGGSPLSDQLALSTGTLNYAGALVISNAGSVLLGGEVFTNFIAPSYSGSFATTVLPTLSAGLNWHLGNLTANGTIKVNRQPVANVDTFTNTPSGVLQITIASLPTNDTDPDGDSLTVSGITLTTTNGITLITNGTFITYSNAPNVNDRFTCVVSDGSGGSATNFVYIVASPVVNIPPSISAQPLSQTVKLGSNVTFSVAASGTPSPAYQWRFNNADILGATATSFIRSNAQFSHAGNYSVFITNVAGVITSSNASLTVLPLAPLWMQSITPLPDGRMALVVTGEPGYTFAVERTTNFSVWQEITNVPNPTGSSSVTDHSASNNANGFYRARQ